MKKMFTKSMMMVISLLVVVCAKAQPGTWLRVRYDSNYSGGGHYIAHNVLSPLSKPKPRDYLTNQTWMDHEGHIWTFGGMTYDQNTNTFEYLNDMWKYDQANDVWIWVNGSAYSSNYNQQNYYPNYGTQGIPSSSNTPGGRQLSTGTTDLQGNLWLLGGGVNAYTAEHADNDLWKYNIATNEWTWMEGDNIFSSGTDHPGFYGTKGVASPQNQPQGREQATLWSDLSGNLWLYGGWIGYGAGGFNDLWKYNISTAEWTWVSGDSVATPSYSYGIRGVSSPTNHPRGGPVHFGWSDQAGSVWLLGRNNDTWKYDPIINEWTWMNGSDSTNSPAIFGTMGVSSPYNHPSSGAYNSFSYWKDYNENIWLYGGANQGGALAFWQYKVSNNQWAWVRGDTIPPSLPLTSSGGGFAAMDTSGYVWTESGSSELWRYTPDTSRLLPVHLLTFTAQLQRSSSLSTGEGRGEAALLNWQVENEQNFDRYQIERSPNGRDFTSIGVVKAANKKEYTYTDSNPTTTPNSKPQTIFYRLKLIDRDGQFTYSPIRQINIQHSTLNIAPNPVSNWLHVQVKSEKPGNATWQVTDIQGRVVMQQTRQLQAGANTFPINISALAKGEYILSVRGETSLQKTFTKE